MDFGANVSLQDINKEKASSYARKNGQQRVLEFLNTCKSEVKRVKDERDRRLQESSQNTIEPRKKKEMARN